MTGGLAARRDIRALALTALLATASVAHPAAALTEPASTTIQQGIDAYALAMQSGDRNQRLQAFGRAEQLFAAAAQAGAHNAALQTNLGSAALQAEHLGQAVLAYRRALLLDPGQARARQNLQHTRGLLPDWVPTPPEAGVLDSFFFWHRTLSREARLSWAAGAFAASCLLLALGIQYAGTSTRWGALAFALVWLGLLISVAFDPARDSARHAVVVVPETNARAADSINAPRRFSEPLPDGTELEIIEDRGGWLHIRLHNGRDAWITASSVERVGPS
jgi:hypothetical protein